MKTAKNVASSCYLRPDLKATIERVIAKGGGPKVTVSAFVTYCVEKELKRLSAKE